MKYYQKLVLAVITLFFIHADLSLGQNSLGRSYCDNNNGNYTSNSAYSANLNATLSSLSTNIGTDGFYNASTGQGIDRVNALVLCRGDLQVNICRDCVAASVIGLLESCPNQKEAIRYDDWSRCTVRYSNATIYEALETSPGYYLSSPQNVTNPVQFKADLRALLDDLTRRATAGSSLMKVAAGNVTGPDFQRIFGLVQCSPDLSSEDCTGCLIGAITEIPQCCEGATGGRVLRPSCNLRFETIPFFNETRLQELDSLPSPSPPPAVAPESPSGAKTIIIVVVVVVVCLILAGTTIICMRKRKKQKPTEFPRSVDEIITVESLQYAFSTIKAATNDFSDDNKLGQGGFGTVYKGNLAGGEEIAVKRLSMESGQGIVEFKNEVLLVAKLQHRNLVRLLGFSAEGTERLLIYEHVQNSSLDKFIFDPIKRSQLDWDKRFKIIGGIAKGLLYLHEDSRLKIIHRDLKASNILLDGDMNPKIADFGMARLFRPDETQANTNRIVGTYGYMSPEYAMRGQFSIKSDVFSFGVLVLEIIIGRRNIYFQNGEIVQDLLTLAWKSWQERTPENMIDPTLTRNGTMRDMTRCIHMGLLCVQENAADRPTMASLILMLSSSTVTLPVPSEPAFYVASRFGSADEHHSTSSINISQDSSRNEMSVTELYPR